MDTENMVLTTPAARLMPALQSDNPAIVASAELELERLCEAGDPNAQRGGLHLLYGAWRGGFYTYEDFAFRAAQVLRIAVTTGTVRSIFVYEGEGGPILWESEAGQLAEYVCVLDMMADAGDPAGMVALGKISDALPAETLDLGRRLRFMPPASAAPPPPLEPFDWSALPTLTRAERLRWWFIDRWWSLRFRLDDARWSLRLTWWRFQDWRASRREGVE